MRTTNIQHPTSKREPIDVVIQQAVAKIEAMQRRLKVLQELKQEWETNKDAKTGRKFQAPTAKRPNECSSRNRTEKAAASRRIPKAGATKEGA